MTRSEQTPGRREFLRLLGRLAAGGALAATAAGLILRRRAHGAAGNTAPCAGAGPCGSCPHLDRCDLPPALTARDAATEK